MDADVGATAGLTTERLNGVRPATTADAPGILAIYAPVIQATAISFELEVPTQAEMERRIETTLRQHPWLVLEVEGEIAGYAYASSHRERKAYQWCVEVSVYVSDRFRRKGVARQLYGSLFAILGRQGYFNAYAGITLPNDASVGLHESLGFVPVGVYREIGYKLGSWHDVGWWHYRLNNPRGAPDVPTPFSELSDP